MRNPKWKRDEVILALDLYFKLDRKQIYSSNPEIIKLSEILNSLPIHKTIPDSEKFRNPNGVSMKMSNFLSIDNTYSGEGLKSASKLDKEVFNEFENDRTQLRRIADQIKSTITDDLKIELYRTTDDSEEFQVKEGKVIYKLHRYRERNSSLSKKMKSHYFKKYGKLDCEVCGFDFYKTYGDLGSGFIECHHIVPLSELKAESETKFSDLSLVCANCHRMLHKEMNTIEELKQIINN